MLKIISRLLRKIANDIDAGNCNMTEEEMLRVLEQMKDINAANSSMSKYEACRLLNVSRPTFDRMVADGKIPPGEHKAGLKELTWKKSDLLRFLQDAQK